MVEENIQKNNKEENKKEDTQKEQREIEGIDGLSKCQKERDEYLDGWKRAKADLINYKKDEAKRFEKIVMFSNESLIRELINILDSFDLALAALGRPQNDAEHTQNNAEIPRESASSHYAAPYEKGLYLIRQQLEDILKRVGLERIIVSVGQPFDPGLQEAIASIESDKPSGTIIEEVEKGYLLNGKLIRPARVKVAKQNH